MQLTDTARRRDRIVNLLSCYRELSAGALADMLGVTVQTLRGDLRALDDAQIVKRRHGGATLIAPSDNIDYQPRLAVSRSEKDRIGTAVAAIVPEGATVALGTGTTVEAVARALVGHRGLTVATNNIHVVMALRSAPDITVLLSGGKVRLRDLDFIGTESIDFFAGLKFDFAIFSVGGVTETGALLDFNLDEIRARRAISACAAKRILVIDHIKLGRPAPHTWSNVQALEHIVCGGILPERLKELANIADCSVSEV